MVLQLTWMPPSTPFDIIGYIIKIQESSYVWNVSTASPHYSFHFSDLNITNQCNTTYHFSLTVCSVNQAGEGGCANTTVIIREDPSGCPIQPTILQGNSVAQNPINQKLLSDYLIVLN